MWRESIPHQYHHIRHNACLQLRAVLNVNNVWHALPNSLLHALLRAAAGPHLRLFSEPFFGGSRFENYWI
jgi:hypothetical protein